MQVPVPEVSEFVNKTTEGGPKRGGGNFPSVRTETVFRVDKKRTWRKIDVCPCFESESYYPQVVSLFACLNANFGERSKCNAEQLAVDTAIIEDFRRKNAASNKSE